MLVSLTPGRRPGTPGPVESPACPGCLSSCIAPRILLPGSPACSLRERPGLRAPGPLPHSAPPRSAHLTTPALAPRLPPQARSPSHHGVLPQPRQLGGPSVGGQGLHLLPYPLTLLSQPEGSPFSPPLPPPPLPAVVASSPPRPPAALEFLVEPSPLAGPAPGRAGALRRAPPGVRAEGSPRPSWLSRDMPGALECAHVCVVLRPTVFIHRRIIFCAHTQ